MRRASYLVLILAAIIDWQILDIDGVLRHRDPTEDGMAPPLLTHISPMGGDHVERYGRFHRDRRPVQPSRSVP